MKEFDLDVFEALVSRVIVGEYENGEDSEFKPYTLTFLLKSNYDNIGRPLVEECDNPVLLEFDSKQKYNSFDMGDQLRIEKKINNTIRVKVKFDI